MIDHRRTLILAAGAIDFDLSPHEQAELDEHLGSCAACRRDSSYLHEQAFGLRDRPRAVPSAALRQRVEAEWRGYAGPRPAAVARRLVLVAAAVIIAIVGLAVVGAGVRLRDTTVRPSVAPSPAAVVPPVSQTPPDVGTLRAFSGLTGAVDPVCPAASGSDCLTDIASGAGAIWVGTNDGVLRFDPTTKTAVTEITLGSLPQRLWFADSSLWVTVQNGALVRIDPATNKVAETVVVGGWPVGVVDGFGSIWVVDQTGDRVVRVDPPLGAGTGARRLTSIPVDIRAWGITAASGAIWLTDRLSQKLVRIDPALDRVVGTIDISANSDSEGTPAKLATGFGRIWITGHTSLRSYDPLTGIMKMYLTQADPRVGIGKDSVWVSGSWNFVIQRLDPVTGAITAQSTLPVAGGGSDFEATVTETPDGRVWVATDQGYRIIEVTPTP